MAKFTALVAVLAILSLVVVDASVHRTIVTTEIEEENLSGGQKCRQQIQRQDLSHCEMYITQSGPMAFNLEHRQQCCQQLRQMDEQCRCDALMEIIRQQQQQGQIESEEVREMMKRAQNIPTYCRMGRCQWSETTDENPQQSCRQQVQRQDFNKCERFITQSGPRAGIIMRTMSNPREQDIQGCCQQLSQVDKQCWCEALKEIVREQQQGQGQYQGEEMQEMMQRAQRIPRMCNMEPRSCQWHLVLY